MVVNTENPRRLPPRKIAPACRSRRRTIRLSRGGTGDGKIVIDDAWDLDHWPERITRRLTTTAKDVAPEVP
jgi:hypothetical protein